MGAIRDLLPPSPPSVPHAPGPFALADRDRLRGILGRAGFVDVAIDPFDFPACLASEGGVEAAVRERFGVVKSGEGEIRIVRDKGEGEAGDAAAGDNMFVQFFQSLFVW